MVSSDGRQIKIVLPGHILDALRQDAKAAGERKIQTVIRHILGQHYQEQARAAGLDIEFEAPPHPAG
jgi:hypothetical protein